jgi:hypothetical protein
LDATVIGEQRLPTALLFPASAVTLFGTVS